MSDNVIYFVILTSNINVVFTAAAVLYNQGFYTSSMV